MAKKKKSLVSSFIKQVKGKRKKNPEGETALISNEATQVLETIAAMGGGYVIARATGRLVRNQTMARWPKLSKHLAILGSMAALGLLALATTRWGRLRKYHMSVWGAGIGVLQGVIQTYLPGLSWLIDATPVVSIASGSSGTGDYEPDDMVYLPAASASQNDDEVASVGDEEDADLRTGIFSPN